MKHQAHYGTPGDFIRKNSINAGEIFQLDTQIPVQNLPPRSIVEVYVRTSVADMLAIDPLEEGDVCVVIAGGQQTSYIALHDVTGGSQLSDWEETGFTTEMDPVFQAQGLKIACNLSDLSDITLGRNNLGLGTAAVANLGTGASDAATGNHLHTGVYEPANSNIQGHIGSCSNPHQVTAAQLGLGNVLNAAQLIAACNLSDLTNFATARSNLGLGSLAVQASNNVSITGGSITGMPNPVNNSDVATKGFVLSYQQGLSPKKSATLATAVKLPNAPGFSANVITATVNGALSVDGIPVTAAGGLEAGADRIIVKNEGDLGGLGAQYDGIYYVTDAGSAGTPYVLTRSSDANTAASLAGAYLPTEEGNTLAHHLFVQTLDPTQTLNVDSAAWNDITASGTVGALLAANNLSDLTCSACARSNLGLGSAAVCNVGTSVGDIPVLNGNASQVLTGAGFAGIPSQRFCCGAGDCSIIPNAPGNSAIGACSSVLGGCNNAASGSLAVVGGGEYNSALSGYAFVGGGSQNQSQNTGSVVAGGIQNCSAANGAVVVGGNLNVASGACSVLGGGRNNRACADFSFIGTGNTNVISTSGDRGVIAGGSVNCISGGAGNFIGGGCGQITGDVFGVIGGGTDNQLVAGANRSVVAGGSAGIVSSPYSVIGGGSNNKICTGSDNSGILGGANNVISGLTNAFVVGSSITAVCNCTAHVNNLYVTCNSGAWGSITLGGVTCSAWPAGGGGSTCVTTCNTSFAVGAEDVVLLNGSAAAVVATLPGTATSGRKVTLKATNITCAVCAARNGHNIDGAASDYVFTVANEAATFIGDGSNWWLI